MPGSLLTRAAAFAALITLLLLGWEHYASRDLRRAELDHLDAALERTARAVLSALDDEPIASVSAERLRALAGHASRASGARVTLIDAEGQVRGDSEVSVARLPEIENHGDRPEVAVAQRGSVGRSSRTSDTVGRELRYVAVPAPGGGVVRLSEDLRELEALVARARGYGLSLIAWAALGCLLLWPLFLWSFHRRPLRQTRRAAEAVAQGRLEDRMPRVRDPELARIGRAVDTLAERLRSQLDQVSGDEAQLRAVLESMVEGLLVVDARGAILLANSRLRELFGSTGDILGRPVIESIRNADLDEILSEAARTNETVSRRVVVSGSDTRTLQVQAVRFPREGERIGSVAVLHDVSELIRLEVVRREFVANASHELRTPLAAIRGFAETLLGSSSLSPEDRKSYLEVIHRHAERLSELVEDLLTLSTIEGRALRLEISPVDVRAVAENLIADARLRSEEKRIRVSVVGAARPLALADPRALEQVLANLFDNALKYSEPDGAIELGIEERGDRVRVRVSDTGIGIPAKELARIFERFYRVDRARSRALGGTGLGLSIVKHLVQAMGGEVFVKSEPDRGSTFHFTLPAADELDEGGAG